MRRLLILTFFPLAAAGLAGCQSTPQTAYCRSAPVTGCNTCNTCGPSIGNPMMGSTMVNGQVYESEGAPTMQATPGTIVPGSMGSSTLVPGPQTYTPSNSLP